MKTSTVVGRRSLMGTQFPLKIEVKVESLDYGPHTGGFGKVFSLMFGDRRQYVLRIGRGNRSTKTGTYVFNLPPDFGGLPLFEQAKALITEFVRIKGEEAASQGRPAMPLYGFYYDSKGEVLISEDEIHCDEGEW
ncbi:hypothetical protein [Silvibacterium acidisoli]|uniref:hypothetical protein n=1 Tax=Acidobacteriaceae bacterium ZG23-2 TaxID=2883246 RepID=UPI00406BEF5A